MDDKDNNTMDDKDNNTNSDDTSYGQENNSMDTIPEQENNTLDTIKPEQENVTRDLIKGANENSPISESTSLVSKALARIREIMDIIHNSYYTDPNLMGFKAASLKYRYVCINYTEILHYKFPTVEEDKHEFFVYTSTRKNPDGVTSPQQAKDTIEKKLESEKQLREIFNEEHSNAQDHDLSNEQTALDNLLDSDKKIGVLAKVLNELKKLI